MPLLRKKPFVQEQVPPNLKADDEVFYCHLTGEVFQDYEAFYQRMILCNSLVWSCELSLRPNLTYKEAQESEENIRKTLEVLPVPLKRSVLMLVHHTRRSKVQILCDDIFDFLKNRYQINEKLEGKINGKWEKGIVTEVPNISNVTFICKHAIPSTVVSLKSPNKNKIKQQSFMDHKDTWPEPNSLEYKFEILKGSLKGTFVPLKGNCVRREKGIFVKEKLKMFLKQCCLRTTTSSDDGYWIVKPSEVNRYSLGMTSIISPEVKSFSKKAKKKESSGALKGNLKNESSLESKPEDLAPKLSKKKEKDEEKARKKDEKEKEKEVLNDIKKLENDFVKEFQKPREDLQLEDSKPFPTLVPFKCKLEPELVGDAIMVVEFVNIFGALLNISKELDTKITFEWLEEALLEHDAEGKYFKLLKSLLHSYLCMEQEETKQVEVDEHSSNSGDETSALSSTGFQSNNVDLIEAKETSQSSRAAAAWPLLHQGMALHEIPIEPFSLTEILRLHILSSGIKTNSRINWVDWQRRGQQQLSDNPCVSFRHTEYDIMNNLVTKCIYDFPPKDKLKILVLICNQALMLSTVREYMEDAFDKLKELRKQLRDIQHEESKRKQLVQKEKWQKVLADRNKHREEMKKKKEQKKLDVKTKDDQKEEDLQLEKQKKEAKDKKMEESFVEKYQLKESEILKEIFNYNLVINEKPLGQDRAFRNYWNLVYTDGLLVENNDGGAFFLANTSDYESEESDLELSGNERKDVANKQSFLPNVTVKDIVEAKENNRSIEDLVFKRYKLPYSNKIHELCNKSTILKTHMDSIKNGEDLSIYSARCSTKWFSVTSKEQLESIIDSLNSRGIRERLLKINLSQKKEQILNYYDKKQELELKKGTRREKLSNKQDDKNDIDKSMFKTMDDFIEANLCDQLVELEEQLWVAGLGGCKENRLEWRLKMEEKMMKLVSNVPVLSNDTEKSKTNNEQFVNGHSESEIDHENKVTGAEHEGDSKPVVKLPLHLHKKDTSRCSTPVIIPDSEKQVAVAELSQELFKIMKSVEMKYLKPPLGETEETRRLRIKEMIEAAKAESEVNKVKKLEKIEEEEQKKSSTCLNRWQESLLKCMNFSQVFVHLYTLDRSIIWDKSVQHVKCRICRRKGDEDEMLLCDGCDRGFHMSCLNPPLKKVPVGNWYCSDCRPVEIRRGYQKHLSKYKGDTEEDEEVSEKEEEYEESESEDDFDAANDNYQVDDDNDDGDEDESDASEHNELCTVCNKDGTLILCEDCPRGFHVECVYPPIKKIPRGSWTCQICRGADQDLPLRKRALTIENQREKVSLGLMSKNGKKQSKKEHSKSKAQKRHASPSTDNTSKRARLEISGDTQELSNSLCRSTTALSRQQLKQCTGLINEIFKRTEAELFLFPVDLDEVPDYTDFIDTPMDFSTIKSKLKDGVYSDISSFISDIHLIFSNCDTYNPPCSHVVRNGRQLKTFINKKLKDLKLL